MMNMDILLIAHFSGELDGSFNSRFTDLCERLMRTGLYHVELLSSDFSHGTKTKKKYRLITIHF